jgi:hypothetical protein
LTKAIHKCKKEYLPQKRTNTTHLCDPQKLIVFYDNDKQYAIKPMAVCLLVNQYQGAFALVDDFGQIMKEETMQFRLHTL